MNKKKTSKTVAEKETLLALKLFKKQRRDEEIARFGHAVNHATVERNRKKYTRKTKHKNASEE